MRVDFQYDGPDTLTVGDIREMPAVPRVGDDVEFEDGTSYAVYAVIWTPDDEASDVAVRCR